MNICKIHHDQRSKIRIQEKFLICLDQECQVDPHMCYFCLEDAHLNHQQGHNPVTNIKRMTYGQFQAKTEELSASVDSQIDTLKKHLEFLESLQSCQKQIETQISKLMDLQSTIKVDVPKLTSEQIKKLNAKFQLNDEQNLKSFKDHMIQMEHAKSQLMKVFESSLCDQTVPDTVVASPKRKNTEEAKQQDISIYLKLEEKPQSTHKYSDNFDEDHYFDTSMDNHLRNPSSIHHQEEFKEEQIIKDLSQVSIRQDIQLDTISMVYYYINVIMKKPLYTLLEQHKLAFPVPILVDEQTPIIEPCDSQKSYLRYYGQLVKGKKCGVGIQIEDNEYLLGFWREDQLIYGQLITWNKPRKLEVFSVLEGFFVDGKAQNPIKIYKSNGEYYEGETHENKMHGSGVYHGFIHTHKGHRLSKRYVFKGTFENGFFSKGEYEADDFKYVGEFFHDLFHGRGTFTNKCNGDMYTGDFVRHHQHGFGTMEYSDGSKYEGQWKHDLFDGEGTFNAQTPDSIIPGLRYYKGEFVKGLRDGKGMEETFDNQKYYGKYAKGFKQGDGGILVTKDTIFEGHFSRDKKHGPGKLYETKIEDRTRTKGNLLIDGTWKEDKLMDKDEVVKLIKI